MKKKRKKSFPISDVKALLLLHEEMKLKQKLNKSKDSNYYKKKLKY